MATKKFHINTERHGAEFGNVTLWFPAEVNGAAFASAYADVMEVQAGVGDLEKNPKGLVKLEASLREFLTQILEPESHGDFEKLGLSMKSLTELIEWVTELYGGGPGNAPGGSSAGS